jgi:peptidoglycan/LPS O-acetylase OafA/YrhL
MTIAPTDASQDMSVATEPRARRSVGFRADLDGLRAIAIGVIVAYHAGISGFGGGFIGVDVFFVISGFLIMGQLDRELVGTGTLHLPTFWARRARRLVPAAVATVLFVVVASQIVYSALHWQTVATEGLAATFYLSNELYRNASTDYFAPALTASPLLNTWSLAVEEQFYLVWPVLILLAGRVLPSRWDRRRLRIGVVATVVVLSFWFGLRMLDVDTPTAYFSALARAWEFGVGALLALTVSHLRRIGPAASRLLLIGGLGLLGWGLLTINDQTVFPGWAAVIPVLGTAAMIAGGSGPDQLAARTIGCRPLQAVGRISYSWYLWHWPVMVLGTFVLNTTATPAKTALVLLSLAPAYFTYRLLEIRLRHAPRLVASNRRTAAVMLAFVLVAAVACAGLWVRGAVATSDPYVQRLAAASADVEDLKPECATDVVADLLTNCVWGDPAGSRTALIIGDSHAAHWLPALDVIGHQQQLRVVGSIQGSCPSLGYGYQPELPTCVSKIAGTPELIRRLHPDLVIVANSVGYVCCLLGPDGQLVGNDANLATWQQGTADRATQLKSLGVPLLIISDTPRFPKDPIDCLVTTRDEHACDATAADEESILGGMHRAEQAAVAQVGWGTFFDANPLLCRDGVCPLEDDGRVMYADGHHLTTAESRALAPPLGDAVGRALAPTAATG